ncbi:MAG TPA: Ig-like domain repeat protein, partial [Agromyces sp.]|nr:Ig-like domain repeat protein [Agromyces sp.]
WTAYAEPVVVSADGSHVVEVRATDAAGNVSEPVAVEVRIDTTAPELVVSLDARKRIVLAAIDELSGVARIEYSTRKNKQPVPGWIEYTAPIDIDGKTLVFVRVIDAAGNVSEVQEVTRKQLD